LLSISGVCSHDGGHNHLLSRVHNRLGIVGPSVLCMRYEHQIVAWCHIFDKSCSLMIIQHIATRPCFKLRSRRRPSGNPWIGGKPYIIWI
jgi:hypothetical protein